jgi:hypothetical protein
LQRAKLFFFILGPKIACQAPKPSNFIRNNNIHMAF